MKLIVAILAIVVVACGGKSPRPARPDGEPLPATAPLPPVVSNDGVYVDPDARFSVQVPPGRHFVHGSNPLLGADLVSAEIGGGNITVMYWKPIRGADLGTLDTLLRDTNASAVRQPIVDVALASATLGRGYRYANPATAQVQGHGEVRAFYREPWIVIVIVFVENGSSAEAQSQQIIDSFKLI